VASKEAYSAMKRARELRTAAGIPLDRPLGCLLTLVEGHAGVPVTVIDLGDGLDGAYVPRPAGTMIYVNGLRPAARVRFTLAHELGHHYLRHGRRVDTPDSLRDTRTRIEADANFFAAELLLPRPALQALSPPGRAPWRPSLDELVHIACAFGVSVPMARIRVQTWNLVNDLEVLVRLDDEIAQQLHLERIDALGLDRDGGQDGIVRACREMPRFPVGLEPGPAALALLS
jgi:Zn-dependent peptidase ImmA (M78 family)